MEITTKAYNDILVLKISGQLNIETSDLFKKNVLAQIEAGQHKLVIDCSLLEYVSSAGIQTLYIVLDEIEAVAGKLALCDLSDSVGKVFDMVDLQADIPIFPNQDAATASMA